MSLHEERGGVGGETEIESALASVARPCARARFKDDLRRRFLVPETAFADPRDAERRRRTLLRVGGLLAAAVILMIGYVVIEPPAPRWKVVDLGAGAVVKADGEVLENREPDALARRLQRAREIEVQNGDLVVQIDDLALFDLGPGTRATFAGFDRSRAGNPFEVRAAAGRLRGRTGPGFRGHTMLVATDVMDVTVVGTAFAIDYEEQGTCICCLHGEVQVAAKALGAGPMPVPPQRMCLVFRDARGPVWGGSPGKHADPLRALEERAALIWR